MGHRTPRGGHRGPCRPWTDSRCVAGLWTRKGVSTTGPPPIGRSSAHSCDGTDSIVPDAPWGQALTPVGLSSRVGP
ncbi:MAG: hypothetical protein KO463_03485, partial [Candidatus Methanofastidiosa archaeon]|nr:hypothetical protein [Candidatus Methanofastidiosa archaeon]